MTKDEALEMLVSEKSVPVLSRAFIAWLYKNGFKIVGEKAPEDSWANWGIVMDFSPLKEGETVEDRMGLKCSD